MSEESSAVVNRKDHRYLATVTVVAGGIVVYFGPWSGHWEQAGLFLLVTGAALWAMWEVILRA